MNHAGMNMGAMATTMGSMDGMDSTGGMDGMDGMDHSADTGHGDSFVIQVAATILFRGWKVDTWEEMLGSCIAVAVVAIAYEALKMLRDFLLTRQLTDEKNKKQGRCAMILSCMHALQTLLYMVQVLISLCLMMVFMTFNLWLCIAVVVGAGVGYFLFGFRHITGIDIDEHCG